MTRDDLNKNSGIKYDHRNLITELRHKTFETDTVIYFTFYSYDESGNRFAKTVYKTDTDLNSPDSISQDDMVSSGEWELYNQEFYSRDVSGRELAIYKNDELEEYPLYGLDLIGKLKNDLTYFYHKDHFGSVRAVVNADNELVSSQDYDPWGYILQDRTFDCDSSKFKFTSKERDEESEYDYFGARYYDARIANWGSIDPLLEKHYDYSPYNYVLRNPLKLVDPDGRQVEIITRTYIPQQYSVNPLYIVYHDNRSADYYSDSYRTEQRMIVEPNQRISSDIITSYSPDIGTTFASPLWKPFEVAVFPGEGILGTPQGTRVSESSVNISIQGEAWETLLPILPSIDYSINFYV